MTLIKRISKCACGQVQFEADGDPIVTAVCYCNDCRAGGRMIEALPNAPCVLDADGGASYLTYRDDRWHCVSGKGLLKGLKLKENSPTKRYVATCCNSSMYLKFKYGHWVSTYRNRFDAGGLPLVEMRTNTRNRQSETVLPTDAPSYPRFPFRLFGKLIAARIAMAVGR